MHASHFPSLKILGLGTWEPPIQDNNPRYHHDAFGLPSAALGPNKYLSDTIDQSIISMNEGVFQILPIKKDDNVHIKWTTIRMDQQMADRAPEQGVTRVFTTSRQEGTNKTQRRGLAIEMDRDFAHSPQGQKEFMYKMRGLVRGFNNTMTFQSMTALLEAPARSAAVNVLDEKYGRETDSEIVANYALVAKTDNSLPIIISRALATMGRHNITPDAIMLPPHMDFFLALQRAGNQPVWQGLDEQKLPATVQGCSIIKTDFVPIDGDDDANPLVRQRHVAEYYLIGKSLQANPTIQIYNEELDDMSTVDLSGNFTVEKFLLVGELFLMDQQDWRTRVANIQNSLSDEPDPLKKLGILAAHLAATSGMQPKKLRLEQRTSGVALYGEEIPKFTALLTLILDDNTLDGATSTMVKIFNALNDLIRTVLIQDVKSAFMSNISLDEQLKVKDLLRAHPGSSGDDAELTSYGYTLPSASGPLRFNVYTPPQSINEPRKRFKLGNFLKRASRPENAVRVNMTDVEVTQKMIGFLQIYIKNSIVPWSNRIGDLSSTGSEIQTIAVGFAADDDKFIASLLEVFAAPELARIVPVGLLTNSVLQDYEYCLIRPAITHKMGTAVAARAGAQTGATVVGTSNFMIAENADNTQYFGNATLRTCSVVTNPRAVYVAKDVFPCGYVRGGGVKIYESYHEYKKKHFPDQYPTAQQVQEYIESGDIYPALVKRDKKDILHLSEPSIGGWPSILCDFVPPEMLSFQPEQIDPPARETYTHRWKAPGAAAVEWGCHVYPGRCIVTSTAEGKVERGGSGHWASLSAPGCAMLRSGNPGSTMRAALADTTLNGEREPKRPKFF